MPPLFHPAAFVPPPIPGDPVQILLVTSCIATATAILACGLLWRFLSRLDGLVASTDTLALRAALAEEALLRAQERATAFTGTATARIAPPEDTPAAVATRHDRHEADRGIALRARARRQADRDATPSSQT